MQPLLDKSAYLISAITSPFIVVLFFGLIAINRYASSGQEFLIWGGTFLLFTILLPLAYILAGLRQGRFSDLHLMVRQQRRDPFLVSLAGAILLYLAYSLENAPPPLLVMSMILIANGLIFFLVTSFWKISLHSASLAGSITITAILVDPSYFTLYLFTPLAVWARVRRKRHNLSQGIAAIFLSIFIALAVFKVSKLI